MDQFESSYFIALLGENNTTFGQPQILYGTKKLNLL